MNKCDRFKDKRKSIHFVVFSSDLSKENKKTNEMIRFFDRSIESSPRTKRRRGRIERWKDCWTLSNGTIENSFWSKQKRTCEKMKRWNNEEEQKSVEYRLICSEKQGEEQWISSRNKSKKNEKNVSSHSSWIVSMNWDNMFEFSLAYLCSSIILDLMGIFLRKNTRS